MSNSLASAASSSSEPKGIKRKSPSPTKETTASKPKPKAIPHVFRYFLLILPLSPQRVYLVKFTSKVKCKFSKVLQALRLGNFFLYCLCELKPGVSDSEQESSAVAAASSSVAPPAVIPAAASSFFSHSSSSSSIAEPTLPQLSEDLKDLRVILPYLFEWFRPDDPSRPGNTGHQEFHKSKIVFKATVGGNQLNVVPHEHCVNFFQVERDWKQYLQRVHEGEFKDVRDRIRLVHDFLSQYVNNGEILSAPLHEIEIRDVTDEDRQLTDRELQANMERIHEANEEKSNVASFLRTGTEPYRGGMNFRKDQTADFTLTMEENGQQVPVAILRPGRFTPQETKAKDDDRSDAASSRAHKRQKSASSSSEGNDSKPRNTGAVSSSSSSVPPSSTRSQQRKQLASESSVLQAATAAQAAAAAASSSSVAAASTFVNHSSLTSSQHQSDHHENGDNEDPHKVESNLSKADRDASEVDFGPFESPSLYDDDSSSSVVSQRLAQVTLPPTVILEEENEND